MNLTAAILRSAALAILFSLTCLAQSPGSQPRQEKLLNGLKVLMWPDASAKNVEIRVRVHSGSAFDPQGKEGVMKLLAENIFPNEAARDYFKDDLGGRLEIITGYDFIEIDAAGKADSFLQMLETVSTALANPAIDKETTEKLKTVLLAKVAELEADPGYVADQAAASRLLGKFPYGRAQLGTPDSIRKIDFADLIDAKQRFLTADNATVAIAGNFDRGIALRAVRRYFGAWLKSDKRVPTAFRQPDNPNVSFQTVPSPRADRSALRFAARGTARKDKDFAASRVFAAVVESRLRSRVPAEQAGELFVRMDEHVLPGLFVVGYSADRKPGSDGKTGADAILQTTLAQPVTESEFSAAKARFASDWSKKDTISFWLDADTFGLQSVDQDIKAADSVTLADVNAYADKLRKQPMVAILANTQPSAN